MGKFNKIPIYARQTGENPTQCLKLSDIKSKFIFASFQKGSFFPCLLLGKATVIKNGFTVYFLRQDIETEIPSNGIIHDPDILREAEFSWCTFDESLSSFGNNSKMQEAFVKINNIPTKITTFGRWITENPKKKGEKIILIIPGNPGMTGFYKEFMKLLYEKHECAVWAISYSGQEYYKQISEDSKCSDLIGLRQQINQKVSFIEEYVPEDAELHIIGHSIGSYMTLEALKEPSINTRIFKTYLLFPTFERMAETPNGKFIYRFIRPITTVVIFLSWIFSILPRIISLNLLSAFMFLRDMPLLYRETIYKLINPKILQQVFFLAYQELEQVKERDDENIKNNLHKIHILYSEIDKWNLSDFYTNIKKDFPDICARTSRYTHAFIFNDNQDVAEIVNKWITDSKTD